MLVEVGTSNALAAADLLGAGAASGSAAARLRIVGCR